MGRTDALGLVTKEAVQIPLVDVAVSGTISGRGAKVKVKQLFKNLEERHIEAVYKFPLPEGGAVCGFRAVVGDRVMDGVIETRDEAFKRYDEALVGGDAAYLLDEERPNIFTLSVGNLPPGATAAIEISYVTLLETRGNETRFFLPTTISPRYVPEATPDEKGIPVDPLVNPPISFDVPYGLSVFLEILGRKSISSVECPSHGIRTQFEDGSVKVEFSADSVKMDRDFVLTISYREDFQSRGYLYRDKRGTFLQLDLDPDGKELAAQSDGGLRKEIIFLLDCSGSMNGNSISEAKTALEVFLKGLEEGMRFNVYRFGSEFKPLFKRSVPVEEQVIRRMEKLVRGIDADLGGTEVLEPLKEIYSFQVPEGFEREIILITDGQVGNEQEVMGLVNGRGKTRLFSVGIGYGPNEYFVRNLARAAGGTCELIAPGEKIQPKILRLFQMVMSKRIEDLKIEWGIRADQSPSRPGAYSGEVQSILARAGNFQGPIGTISVSGTVGGSRREWKINIEEVSGADVPIPVLWGREKIKELEDGFAEPVGSRQEERKKGNAERIVGISREFGLISRETSFVAVEKREGKDKHLGEIDFRKVPAMLTKGWGGLPGLAVHAALAFNKKSRSAPMITMRDERQEISERPVALYDRLDSLKTQRPSYSLTTYREPANRGDDLLTQLLLAQSAEGGFNLNERIAHILGIPLEEVRYTARRMETAAEVDAFKLLGTAIVLSVLYEFFSARTGEWMGIVQKTERWFEETVSTATPSIDGMELRQWAKRFTHSLNIRC